MIFVCQMVYLWLILGASLATPVAENVQGRHQLSARAAILENISFLRIIRALTAMWTATLFRGLSVSNATRHVKPVLELSQQIV